MTRQEQIEEMAKDLENTILGLGIHLCRKSAEKLYDLGYRKGETISYKAMIDHSYLDRINELLIDFDEMGFVPTTLCENPDEYAQDWKKQLVAEIERLKAENIRLTTKLGQVLLSIDTVKEMNAMCNIEEQVKQAKIDVLNKLKSLSIYDDNYLDGYVFIDDIDKLLEEYENDATRND